MRQCRFKVDISKKDKGTFGKFEPGNKVYYDDLESYFLSRNVDLSINQHPGVSFSFKEEILPKLRVIPLFYIVNCSTDNRSICTQHIHR